MPELPEIETIRTQLESAIVGKFFNKKKIIAVRRRGKIIVVSFVDGSGLMFHLKLTGQLLFNVQPSRFTREVFQFDNGASLVFNDVRKFGWWKQVKSPEETKEIKQLGPDALDINEQEFRIKLDKRKNAKIKSLLMDQKFVAGIGNIYADEILFDAKVSPIRFAKTLNPSEAKRIFLSMGKILKAAIRVGGSSVRDYIDLEGKKGDYTKHHKVYRKTGQPCPKCGSKIQRIKLNQRSSHFCPQCQK